MTNITGFVRSLISSQSRKVELIRYIIVGGIATLSQYGFYVMLVRLAGMSTILSAPVSYGLSFCVNFILSNYFTFHTRPNAKSIFICGQPSHQSGIADYACRTFCQYSRKYLCTAACNGHMRTCELLSRAFCPHRPPLSRDTGDDGIITVPHPNNTAVTER